MRLQKSAIGIRNTHYSSTCTNANRIFVNFQLANLSLEIHNQMFVQLGPRSDNANGNSVNLD